jgi:hypothetical protein
MGVRCNSQDYFHAQCLNFYKDYRTQQEMRTLRDFRLATRCKDLRSFGILRDVEW